MKKCILIILSLLLYCFGFSQTVIDIDLSTDQPISAVLNDHRTTTLEIRNINTILYKVDISGRNVYMSTNVPSEFNALMQLEVKDAQETAEAKEDVKGQADEMNEIASSTTDPLMKSAMTDVVAECNNYIAILKDFTRFLREAKTYSEDLFKSPNNISFSKFNANSQDLIGLLISYPTIETSCANFETCYKKVESKYEAAIEIAGIPPADKADIEHALGVIEGAHHTIDDKADEIANIISEIKLLKSKLSIPSNFIVKSSPIQVKGDYIAFDVIITPTDKGASAITWPTIEVPVKGGLKVDFSVGLIMSFGKNAHDDKFYLRDTASLFKLGYLENKSIASPALAAMMHAYRRSGSQLAFGGMLGVGAGFQSVDDSNFRLFVGGTAVIGREQKVFVSAGIGFQKVDRLKSPQYDNKTAYASIDLSDVTQKELKPSLFFSVSYNLTNRAEVN